MATDQRTESEVKRDADFLAHGLEAVSYVGGPGEPYFQPVMECMCGYSTGRCMCWADAGRELDRHLVSVGVA